MSCMAVLRRVMVCLNKHGFREGMACSGFGMLSRALHSFRAGMACCGFGMLSRALRGISA